MASYFRTRRSVYINIAMFFLLVIVWCVSYMQPVMRSFFKDDHLFFGKVTYAAIPSIFGGSNIPFLDKTFFQINGDSDATFVLYSSQEMNEDMAKFFSFAEKGVENIPIEVSAVRISDNKFIVKSLATRDVELDWDTLSEYHLFCCFNGLGVVGVAFVGMVVFLVLGIRSKR